MELWILTGLVAAGLAAVAVVRLRKPRRRASNEAKNIYPLW